MPTRVEDYRRVAAGFARRGRPLIGLGRELLVPGYFYPDESNTGLTDESALTVWGAGGNVTFNTPGQLVEDKRFEGYVYVEAPGVEFRNCLPVGPLGAVNPIVQCTHANIGTNPDLYPKWIDSEFRPRTNTINTGTIQGRYQAIRCKSSGAVDGMGMLGDSGKILGCLIESLLYFSPSTSHSDNQTHSDGIQIHGGNGHQIIGNRIVAMSSSYDALRAATYDGTGKKDGGNAFWSPGMTEAPTLAGIMVNSSTASGASASGNILIHRNWLDGGSYIINAADPNALSGGGLTITENLFGNRMGFGPTRHLVTLASKSNITASGNKAWNYANPLDRSGADIFSRYNI